MYTRVASMNQGLWVNLPGLCFLFTFLDICI